MNAVSIPVHWIDFDGRPTTDRSIALPCLRIYAGLRSPSVTISPAIDMWAMIDTGADICQFDQSIYAELGAKSKKTTPVHGHNGTSTSNVYEMDIIPKDLSLKIEIEAIDMTTPEMKVPFRAIIGKHLFQYGRLILDRPSGKSEFLWNPYS